MRSFVALIAGIVPLALTGTVFAKSGERHRRQFHPRRDRLLFQDAGIRKIEPQPSNVCL
jgi:hypothetical protein